VEEAVKPAAGACICHQQNLLSDWHVPTAAAEVRLAPVQALQPTLHRDEVTHNLQILITTKMHLIREYSNSASKCRKRHQQSHNQKVNTNLQFSPHSCP